MVAAAMSATLSALILFSHAGVLFTFVDVTKALKSALCFEIAAANLSDAEIAASMMVGLVALGEGGLDAYGGESLDFLDRRFVSFHVLFGVQDLQD